MSLVDLRSDGSAWLTLSDTRLSIIGSAKATALAAEIERVTSLEDVRVLVLRGNEGGSFVAGADIKEMMSLDATGARTFITHLRSLLEAIRKAPVPVIAAIDGWCLGVGLELAAVCDLRIGTTRAKFGMPEVKLGMPSVLHASILPSLVGEGRARWILLTGEIFDSEQAQSWGVLQGLVPPEMLSEATEELVRTILDCGPHGIRLQKALLTHWQEGSLNLALDYSTALFGQVFETSEPQNYIQQLLDQTKATRG